MFSRKTSKKIKEFYDDDDDYFLILSFYLLHRETIIL